MTQSELNDLIVEFFPELKEKFDEEMAWWDIEEPGSHNIYGNVFNPFAIDEILIDPKRIFDFIEFVLEKDDDYATDVMIVTVLEFLTDVLRFRKDLIKFAGKRSKDALDRLLDFFGRT